jgi:hypothetical protein
VNKFLNSEDAEFILFLSSRAHLENIETLKHLVTEDVDVVSPMLQTNNYIHSVVQYCDYGWDRTSHKDMYFDWEASEGPLRNQLGNRILVCFQSIHLIHLGSNHVDVSAVSKLE